MNEVQLLLMLLIYVYLLGLLLFDQYGLMLRHPGYKDVTRFIMCVLWPVFFTIMAIMALFPRTEANKND